jgi:hypothetical protein
VEFYKNFLFSFSFFVNAIIGHVRPVWIFLRVYFKNGVLSGDSAFPIGAANPTGWLN